MTEDYRPDRVDAADALAFASMVIKKYYNQKYKDRTFDVGDFVVIRLYRGYRLLRNISPKLQQQFAGPFKVLERVEKLAYRLKLPVEIKVYPVVSVAYLKEMKTQDPYNQEHYWTGHLDDTDEPEPSRLLNKRTLRRRGGGEAIQYLAR